MDTAGEIEARDVSSRRSMDAEQRKNTRPDIDREDVVFVDYSGVSYDKGTGDNSTIKKQINNNLDRLNTMSPVANVNETNLPKGKERIRKWAVDLLRSSGYKIDRQGFGIIEFSPKHIDEGIKYLSEDAEVAAFAALPKVLKRGIVIDSHEKHKGNLRNSITIAAPVVINGVRGNMAVAITVTTKNHYHVHRIVMPDGSRFTFDVKKNKAEPTLHSAVETGEEAKDSAYEKNITHKSQNVNYSRRDSAEGLTKEEARAQAAAYTRLKAENAELRRRVEYWKGQTQRTKQATVRQADVNRFSRQLIKRYGSTADQATIRQALQEIGDYLVQNNGEALDFACRSKLRNKVIDTKP